MTQTFESMKQLVDLKNGLVSRDIFVDPDIYQQELEQVFARSWLFIGHESQIPNPNDFFVSRMGEESVILTRTRQGDIQVLLNTCMHRGMKVCRYDEGNTPVFSCPYHGWSYSTDGKLVSVPGELIGVPQFATAYHGELEKENWGLVAVPKMYNYKGLIWACWDKNAPDFIDYLGDFSLYLDDLTASRDGRDGGSEAIVGVQKWRLPANWKYPVENASDAYHGISHRSEVIIGTGPGGPGSERHARSGLGLRRGSLYFLGRGHHTIGGLPTPDYDWFPDFISPWDLDDNLKLVTEYFEEVKAKRKENVGDKLVYNGGVASVFPNMSFHSRFPREIALWNPAGAQMTEGWHWYLVDKDMPRQVKDLLRRYLIRYSGPPGFTEEDDMENWNYATASSHGTIAQRHKFHYGQGMGYEETPPPNIKGATFTPDVSEQNARGFLGRWSEMMDAKTWDELWPPQGEEDKRSQ